MKLFVYFTVLALAVTITHAIHLEVFGGKDCTKEVLVDVDGTDSALPSTGSCLDLTSADVNPDIISVRIFCGGVNKVVVYAGSSDCSGTALELKPAGSTCENLVAPILDANSYRLNCAAVPTGELANRFAELQLTLGGSATITFDKGTKSGQAQNFSKSARDFVGCNTVAGGTPVEGEINDNYEVTRVQETEIVKSDVSKFTRAQNQQDCYGDYDADSTIGFYIRGAMDSSTDTLCNTANTNWTFEMFLGPGVKGCAGTPQIFQGANDECDSHAISFDYTPAELKSIGATAKLTFKVAVKGTCNAVGKRITETSSIGLGGVAVLEKSAGIKKDSSSPSSSTCFPASALVTMEDGSSKKISALEVDNVVLAAKNEHSAVHMFSHYYPEAINPFVHLTTAQGHELRLTASHYLYVNGSLVTAGNVRVGDALEDANGAVAMVVKKSVVRDTGLYNPHTLHGDIVINGIRTSTYTDSIHPTMAHALLAPIRALYTLHKKL